jgi:hypothetical protein
MVNPEYSRKFCCYGCIFSLRFDLGWKFLSKILHFCKFYDKEVKIFYKNSGGRVQRRKFFVLLPAAFLLLLYPTPLQFPAEGWLLALWGCHEENKREWC